MYKKLFLLLFFTAYLLVPGDGPDFFADSALPRQAEPLYVRVMSKMGTADPKKVAEAVRLLKQISSEIEVNFHRYERDELSMLIRRVYSAQEVSSSELDKLIMQAADMLTKKVETPLSERIAYETVTQFVVVLHQLFHEASWVSAEAVIGLSVMGIGFLTGALQRGINWAANNILARQYKESEREEFNNSHRTRVALWCRDVDQLAFSELQDDGTFAPFENSMVTTSDDMKRDTGEFMGEVSQEYKSGITAHLADALFTNYPEFFAEDGAGRSPGDFWNTEAIAFPLLPIRMHDGSALPSDIERLIGKYLFERPHVGGISGDFLYSKVISRTYIGRGWGKLLNWFWNRGDRVYKDEFDQPQGPIALRIQELVSAFDAAMTKPASDIENPEVLRKYRKDLFNVLQPLRETSVAVRAVTLSLAYGQWVDSVKVMQRALFNNWLDNRERQRIRLFDPGFRPLLQSDLDIADDLGVKKSEQLEVFLGNLTNSLFMKKFDIDLFLRGISGNISKEEEVSLARRLSSRVVPDFLSGRLDPHPESLGTFYKAERFCLMNYAQLCQHYYACVRFLHRKYGKAFLDQSPLAQFAEQYVSLIKSLTEVVNGIQHGSYILPEVSARPYRPTGSLPAPDRHRTDFTDWRAQGWEYARMCEAKDMARVEVVGELKAELNPEGELPPTLCGEDRRGDGGVGDLPEQNEEFIGKYEAEIHPDLKGRLPDWLLQFVEYNRRHPITELIAPSGRVLSEKRKLAATKIQALARRIKAQKRVAALRALKALSGDGAAAAGGGGHG